MNQEIFVSNCSIRDMKLILLEKAVSIHDELFHSTTSQPDLEDEIKHIHYAIEFINNYLKDNNG